VSKVDPSLLIDSIYEASVVPELWPEVLGEVTRLSGTAWTVAVSVRDTVPHWILSESAAQEAVAAHYDLYPGNQRTTRLADLNPFGFVTDYDLLTQAEIDREPLYQEYLIPKGYGFAVGTTLSLPDGDMVVIHSEGRYGDGPVSPMVVNQLDKLRPHLARAALLSTRLSFERTRTAVETLEAVGLVACGVAASGAVLVANRLFDAEREFLSTRGGDRVALHDVRANLQLEQALARIFTGGVQSIPMLGAGGFGLPAVLHVVPVRKSARDVFNQVAAILILTKATQSPIRSNSLLQVLFDLTPMEAALAARIASAHTVEEIALEDGKTPGTVRTQLKGVFAKTGCRRQAELARLLTQIVPAGM
jgi:DNA-binding CsgD family transcriptional regulator